jgi:hypothetical protein
MMFTTFWNKDRAFPNSKRTMTWPMPIWLPTNQHPIYVGRASNDTNRSWHPDRLHRFCQQMFADGASSGQSSNRLAKTWET